jgi:CheY-like chemotaxis protein
MFVAQPQDATILLLDAYGRRVGALGHKGEGPGEFRTISHVGWLGDSLWVVDARLGRATLFTPDGTYATSFPAGINYPYPYSRSVASALLEHGHAVLPVSVSLPALVSGDRRRAPVLLVDRNMAGLDTLATVDLTRSRLISKTPDGGMLVSSQQPYDDSPLVRTGNRGREIIVVERSVARSSSIDSFEVTAFDADGHRTWSRWLRYAPQTVNTHRVDSLIDQIAQDFASTFTSQADAKRAVRAALFVPRFAPPVTDCVVGADGTVWLRRDVFAADGMEWTILNPDGSSMARARSGGPTHLFDASGTRAWGVEYSELDVPFVVRYRLENTRVGWTRMDGG